MKTVRISSTIVAGRPNIVTSGVLLVEAREMARRKLASIMLPSTSPRVTGAVGKPRLRITKPSTPKKNIMPTSKTRLLHAYAPITQSTQTTGISTRLGTLITRLMRGATSNPRISRKTHPHRPPASTS